MAKEYVVGDTSYEFPDHYTDQQVQAILTKQGVIKAPEQPGAISRFFSGVGEVLNPIPAIKQVIDNPLPLRTNTRAVYDVLSKPRGTPEEAAALERNANVLPNPYEQTLPRGTETVATAYGKAAGGDYAGAAGALTGGYGVPAAVGYGVAKAAPYVFTQAGRQRVGQALQKGQQAVARRTSSGLESLETTLGGPRDPVLMMNQALRPAQKNLRFNRDIDKALPEIKASEATLGRPISTIEDMHEAVLDAKRRIWGQIEEAGGDQWLRQVSLEPVADAIEKTITGRMKLHDPASVEATRAMANRYRGRTFTIQEAEELLQGANADLESYFGKNPMARRAEISRNPDTARINAEAEALRDRINRQIDQPSGGQGMRELKRRYGALSNAEGEIYRRTKVADRQAPLNLPEQLAGIEAAGETAVGGARLLFGDPGGALQILRGAAKKEAGRALREYNTTNSLIERTFRNYNREPSPVNIQRVQPRALLGPGPIVTPPPVDPSGIRVVPGEPYLPPGNRTLEAPRPRTLGELAAPPVITPPPVDPSGIQILDAAAGIAIDPKTGRIFRYFTSEGQ